MANGCSSSPLIVRANTTWGSSILRRGGSFQRHMGSWTPAMRMPATSRVTTAAARSCGSGAGLERRVTGAGMASWRCRACCRLPRMARCGKRFRRSLPHCADRSRPSRTSRWLRACACWKRLPPTLPRSKQSSLPEVPRHSASSCVHRPPSCRRRPLRFSGAC